MFVQTRLFSHHKPQVVINFSKSLSGAPQQSNEAIENNKMSTIHVGERQANQFLHCRNSVVLVEEIVCVGEHCGCWAYERNGELHEI